MANLSEYENTRVELCGEFVVEIKGRRLETVIRGRQAQSLFAYLVLHRKRPVRREELVDALWPEQSPASPASALRTLVSRLRKALGEGIIVGRSELTLELPADALVDLEAATEGIKRAERALERSSWAEAMSAAEDALSVADGGFLPRVEAHWAEDERRRLDELCLRALECLAACGLGLGGLQLSATERAARRLIEVAPYRETGYRYLIEALAARGRVAEALQVFDGVRRLLQEELGVPPSPGLRSLHERLLKETGLEWRSERDDPLAVRPPSPDAAGAAPAPLALPSAFFARAGEFVGRGEDLERLWGVYEQASSRTCHVVFLRGEAGIGKTRLAIELALRAHSAGAVVLYGRCDEEPLLPHQPFVEALQHYVAACPVAELREQVSPSSGELRRLVPELAERLPDLAPPVAGDPEGERYRLFEAVAALLRRVGESRPVVLVLDDLHWADKPTLLLLRHLARHARSTALLVVGTYRDASVAPGHPFFEALADIGREHRGERLTLRALDAAAVAVLVRSHAGEQAPELVRSLLEETDGNPLFIVELLRHLTETGAFEDTPGRATDLRLGELGIPEGVKDVIGRRIARLGDSTRRVLAIASVSGRNVELAVLERASELAQDELVEALEEAARAGVIEEVGGVADRYTFTHSLIRDTIYGDLSAVRRAHLHRRVAVSLEAIHAAELDAYSAELAHHFRQAGSPSDLVKAIEHGARAGDTAVAQLAYEHAAAHYRQAVALIDAVELPRRQAQRCDLVIAQGEAERQAGNPAYRETLFEGARLAHELGDAERLARAALANNRGFASSLAGVDGERVAVLDAALAACGPHDSALRASLLAQLAVELVADPDWRRRAQLSDEALAIARRMDDPRTLARTLNSRYVALWGPQTLSERLVNSREAVGLAERLEDPLISFQAARFGSHAAMEAGELALADRRLERASELADQLGQPILHWYFAVTRAKRSSISGSLAEAEQLARDAFEVGQRARQPDAALWLVIQLFVIRLLRGTLASAMASPIQAGGIWEPPSGVATRPSRSVPLLLEAVRIATACEAGRSEDVRERFDTLMKDELNDLPYDWMALVIPCIASVACVHLRDVPRAQTLNAMLEPYAGQFVDSGPSWFGATSHHLANLATTLGRYEEADAHFLDATDAYIALGAEAWLIRARRDWARMLIARRTGRDMQRAQELLRNVLAAAQNNGLTELESATASLLEWRIEPPCPSSD